MRYLMVAAVFLSVSWIFRWFYRLVKGLFEEHARLDQQIEDLQQDLDKEKRR